jgi:hemoglobin
MKQMGEGPDDLDERRRRAAAAARLSTGIDEALIDQQVRVFYGRVRQDPLLGPIFAARITDWEPHLLEISAFWSSVLLQSGRYHGRPMQKHAALAIDATHFDRWLQIWEMTARDVCPKEAAALFIARARRIAESLELGIATSRGNMLAPGERLAP